jgi:hypothetical protein
MQATKETVTSCLIAWGRFLDVILISLNPLVLIVTCAIVRPGFSMVRDSLAATSSANTVPEWR